MCNTDRTFQDYTDKQKLREAETHILYLQERITTLKLQLSQVERSNLTISQVIQEDCDENGEFNRTLCILRTVPTTEGIVVIVR